MCDVLDEDARRFYSAVHSNSWIRLLDWSAWRNTVGRQCLKRDPDAITSVSPDDLAYVLTACVRADRFCDGYLEDAFGTCLITWMPIRAEQWLKLQEPRLVADTNQHHRKTTA